MKLIGRADPKPGTVLASPGAPSRMTGMPGTAYADLRRGDIVLPHGWRIEHVTKTSSVVAATGHNRRGEAFCLSGSPTRKARILRST